MPGNDVVPDLIGHPVQKHSETARDTIKMKGIASGFPIEIIRGIDTKTSSLFE